MVRTAHLPRFFQTRHQGVGRHPDAETQEQNDQHAHDGLSILGLRPRNPVGDAQPEIVVRAEEEHADQHGLQNEQPGEESAHEGDAHLLVVLIDLAHQPVAGEGQRQQAEDADEVADVAHPIVVVALIGRLRAQVPNSRIGAANVSAEHHVGDEAMNVHRPPGRIPCRRPSALQIGALRNDHRAGLERGPGIRDDHNEKSEHVQEEAQENVERLGSAFRHGIPAIPVQVECGGFEQKQSAVRHERRKENIRQIVHQFGIEADQQEQEDAAE